MQAGRISRATEKGYDTTRRALKEFKKEIRIKDIDAKLIKWLRAIFDKNEVGKTVAGDVLGSRANRLKHVRTVIFDIERRGVPIKNPYRTREECVVPEAAVNDTFLEYDELSRMFQLMKSETEIGTTEFRVLVMYIFSCATGIRLSDALRIKWGNL